MSRGTLKLLAILLMAGNHIAQVFLTPNTVSYHLLLTLGYATAPLMYAFLSDGFITSAWCSGNGRRSGPVSH